MADDRRYFLVKHGLDSLQALPNYIWRTGLSRDKPPRLFNKVRRGDRWVGFAYADSDKQERSLRLVTGFSECVCEMRFGDIPSRARSACDEEREAWLIQGVPYGRRFAQPVGVPPVNDILGRVLVARSAVTEITAEDFERFQTCAHDREFDPNKVPVLGREPRNEQELLAVVTAWHEQLGIERIFRIRTAFPDMLVKIKGYPAEVHLELELYSRSFRHHKHVTSRRNFADGKPVAVLCWIDDDKTLKGQVHHVFELQSLIRDGQRIKWR